MPCVLDVILMRSGCMDITGAACVARGTVGAPIKFEDGASAGCMALAFIIAFGAKPLTACCGCCAAGRMKFVCEFKAGFAAGIAAIMLAFVGRTGAAPVLMPAIIGC